MLVAARESTKFAAFLLFLATAAVPFSAWAEAINIGLSSAAGNLDPVRSNSGPDFEVTRQIFDTLVVRNEKTGEYEPNLGIIRKGPHYPTTAFVQPPGIR